MKLISILKTRINNYRQIPPTVQELYKSVRPFLPSNPVIIEAGAHMGYDTLGLSKIWPKGRVYGFEPVPDLFDALCERVKNQSNVKTYNIALGKTNTTISLHVSGGQSSGSSSILKPLKHLELFPGVTFNQNILAKMKTLKDWASEENILTIDLVWLDMQGYEVYALEGAGALLNKISVIYTELCRNELYDGLITRDAYTKFLNSSGFELVSTLDMDAEITDGIFVNRNLIR